MQSWTPEDLQTHLEKGETVFLKLWKKGCGPCKLSTPAIERIEESRKDTVTFGQICTDDHPEMFEITGVDSVPAFFVFKGGEMKGQFMGFKGLKPLEEFVTTSLKS